MEPDLGTSEVSTGAPGKGTALGRATEATEIDLDEAFWHGIELPERNVSGHLAVASPQVLVDVWAMPVIGGDQHAAPRLYRDVQRRLERGDVLGRETYRRTRVRRTDLIVNGVEDGADHGDRLSSSSAARSA